MGKAQAKPDRVTQISARHNNGIDAVAQNIFCDVVHLALINLNFLPGLRIGVNFREEKFLCAVEVKVDVIAVIVGA